ncbi:unnamed protein product [Gordionus sp. m RMFG-2023]|uniref:serine/threonine-protein phosphatase 5-like n=1 Tax=Gordionus sp. m RMFG-2023 TaxID=3053472 RepID=UPI0030DED09B
MEKNNITNDNYASETNHMLNGDVNDINDESLLAEEFKNKANLYFKSEDYKHAIEYYDKAIEKNPNNAVYFANRSFAHLKMESYGYALNDATKAIELDNKYLKGYYRRAAANMALGKMKVALKDFETVTKVCPNDKDAKLKYNACNKIVKALAFQKAIFVDVPKKSIVDSVNLSNIEVEKDYKGPTLKEEDDYQISLQFVNEMIQCFKDQKKIHKKFALKILLDVREIFAKESTLVDVNINKDQKLTICGDIHGQFFDMLHIFDMNGMPSPQNLYLFNGDFVDRGSFSVEVMLTLLAFKALYPNSFYLTRGNHETATMNQMYGFEGEVKSKYSQTIYTYFAEIFCLLPLAYLIQGKVLVMHGGIFSQDDVTLDDIRKIDRNREPPESGLMCELLWSDPQFPNGRAPSKRGVGIAFGPDVTHKFLEKNGLDYIIRSHEVKDNGYEVAHDGKCVTVFSAPNYCDSTGNKGAYITLTADNLTPKFTTFEAVPHPNVKAMAYANSLMGFL